jgi:hypothetical protein
MDTYESTLEDPKKLEKVKDFRTYIQHNWDRIFDWREKVGNPPNDARGSGAMESNQRHISFRMKKRGMHWSPEGGEAMVKVKQGILNQTLRAVYLKHQHRSKRKQRDVKKRPDWRVFFIRLLVRQLERNKVELAYMGLIQVRLDN